VCEKDPGAPIRQPVAKKGKTKRAADDQEEVGDKKTAKAGGGAFMFTLILLRFH
jgi:hypothetical protein